MSITMGAGTTIGETGERKESTFPGSTVREASVSQGKPLPSRGRTTISYLPGSAGSEKLPCPSVTVVTARAASGDVDHCRRERRRVRVDHRPDERAAVPQHHRSFDRPQGSRDERLSRRDGQ